MYSIETVYTFDKFLELELLWNKLLEKSDIDVPFMTFEWTYCYWKSTGTSKTMLILLIKEDNEVIAIAPLMKTKVWWRGMPFDSIIFLGEDHYFRTGIISSKFSNDIIAFLMDYLSDAYPGAAVMCLDIIERHSFSDRALRGSAAVKKMNYIEIASDISPYIRTTNNWEEYIASRSRSFRHKLRHTQNLFAQNGNYKIVKYTNDSIPMALDGITRIFKNTWKYRQGTSFINDSGNMRFYTNLSNVASVKNWLNIWMLYISGEPAAFAYNIAYKNKIYALQISYDEKHSSLSPSEFLNYHAIKDCFENKYLEYDWLGRNLPFKMRWTDHVREHVKYIIFTKTLAGRMAYLWKTQFIAGVEKIFNSLGIASD